MKKLKTLALTTAVSLGLLGSNASMAETQGSLGATSEGTFDIKLSLGQIVQIWGFNDLYFTGNDKSPAMNLCVKNNDTNNTVRLSVEGSFKLGTPTENGANYSVSITDTSNAKESVWGSGASELDSGEFSTVGYTTQDSSDAVDTTSCADGSTYNAVDLTVQVKGTKGTGVFSDTVTVTVFPI
ncbi:MULTISPECIES: hypothetical protein [unclassified Endozoicomonas]|uniref:hypothetical protein n=1 Tax=unclassified Endozoicomonas TaxID=2644528 RepID=UPI003BB8027E